MGDMVKGEPRGGVDLDRAWRKVGLRGERQWRGAPGGQEVHRVGGPASGRRGWPQAQMLPRPPLRAGSEITGVVDTGLRGSGVDKPGFMRRFLP